jgi:hypothetical protein
VNSKRCDRTQRRLNCKWARTGLADEHLPNPGWAPGRLGSFDKPALVVWAPEDMMMPPEHGRRLADLLPDGRLLRSRTATPSFVLINRSSWPRPYAPSWRKSTDSPRLGDAQARREVGFYDHGDPPAQRREPTIAQRSTTTSDDALDLDLAQRKRGRHESRAGQAIRGGWQEGGDLASGSSQGIAAGP